MGEGVEFDDVFFLVHGHGENGATWCYRSCPAGGRSGEVRALFYQFTEGFVGGRKYVEHVSEGYHSAVGEEIITIIEMTAKFAAENSFGVPKRFFHKCVSDAITTWPAAVSLDLLPDNPAGTQIIDNCCVWVFLKEIFSHQSSDYVTANRSAGLIDNHKSIGITVETKAHVGFFVHS